MGASVSKQGCVVQGVLRDGAGKGGGGTYGGVR